MRLTHHVSILAVFVGIFVLTAFVTPVEAVAQQSWEKKIQTSKKRFIVLRQFNNEAVFDKETGLVWEQSPDTDRRNWGSSLFHCANREVGGRVAWRAPSFVELMSLVDRNSALCTGTAGGLCLLDNHPFSNVGATYWSATTIAGGNPTEALFLDFADGFVGENNKPSFHSVWCVRGPMNADAY